MSGFYSPAEIAHKMVRIGETKVMDRERLDQEIFN